MFHVSYEGSADCVAVDLACVRDRDAIELHNSEWNKDRYVQVVTVSYNFLWHCMCYVRIVRNGEGEQRMSVWWLCFFNRRRKEYMSYTKGERDTAYMSCPPK